MRYRSREVERMEFFIDTFARLNLYFIADTRIYRKNSVTTKLLRWEKYFCELELFVRSVVKISENSKAKLSFIRESEHGDIKHMYLKSVKRGEKRTERGVTLTRIFDNEPRGFARSK